MALSDTLSFVSLDLSICMFVISKFFGLDMMASLPLFLPFSGDGPLYSSIAPHPSSWHF